MTGSHRRYALVACCALTAGVLLAGGAKAWATATVHRTMAQCDRRAVIAAPHASAVPAAGGQGREPRSWRVHALRVAGCGAWRQVHDRMHRRQYLHRGA
jgi:hypothetical protein